MTKGTEVRTSGPGTVHVLIVGVGSYDGGVNVDLPGVAAAAIRVRDWWHAAGDRLIDGRRVGSIEILVCGPGSSGSGSAEEVPTAPHVKSAFERWITLCHDAGDGGMGFLFWVGHGTAAGSTSGAVSQALLCKDWNGEDPEDGFQEGIDWNATLQAIDARCGTARMFCFIDACRSPTYDERIFEPALRPFRRPHEASTFVLYSARSLRKGWSSNVAHLPSGFPGGPLMIGAITDALGRFGALADNPTLGHFATPNLVMQAVRHQMQRWANWIAADQGVRAPLIRLDFVQGDWFDAPMLKVASPGSMLDVVPSPGSSVTDAACSVRCCDSGDIQPKATPRQWEADIGRGSTEVRVLRHADSTVTLSLDFPASHAFHHVTVP